MLMSNNLRLGSRAVRSRASRGFTLIELMVVMAIIIVLIAILLPMVSRANQHAKAVKCASNLHQHDVAIQAWEYGRGKLPYATEWDLIVLNAARGDYRILYCPEDDAAGRGKAYGFRFLNWHNKPDGVNPNGGRTVPPDHPWKVLRIDISPTVFELSISYKPQQGDHFTDDLRMRFTKLGSSVWQPEVVHALAGARTDMEYLAPNAYFRAIDIQSGMSLPSLESGGNHISYGFNFDASDVPKRNQERIVIMDYKVPIFDYDGLYGDDDAPATLMAPRHFKGVNALFSDHSVRRAT